MKRKRLQRRGIILLVVLSLLTLFTLLMVTFVIVAGQFRDAAVASARPERGETDAAERILDHAFYTLMRDSTSPTNPGRGHSLLLDMYGTDGFIGEIQSVESNPQSNGSRGTFVKMFLQDNTATPTPTRLDRQTYYRVSKVRHYYNGCVLTATSGRARGRSFRIIGYDDEGNGIFFRVMAIQAKDDLTVDLPEAGDEVVINGRPFNGVGFGYNKAAAHGSAKLNSTYTLHPNRVGDSAASAAFEAFLRGDADESYDAPDFQNMALAAVIPNDSVPDGVIIIPSFHRPALVRYWNNNGGITNHKGAVFRPMYWDHSDFDGSNTSLGRTQLSSTASLMWGVNSSGTWINPWDVDNDGDGVPDSIWVDFGFAPQTTADGRLVKPLAAIMCIDLDGRLNLNAHGSSSHIANLQPTSTATHLAGGSTAARPRGSGAGPAEINLEEILSNSSSTDELSKLLGARYGADARPGLPGDFGASTSPQQDAFALAKFFDHPSRYFDATGITGAYSSPPDLFGELSLGLDYGGQPSYDTPNYTSRGQKFQNLLTDNPYEFDLSGSRRGREDTPFTASELERLLRYADPDSERLRSRLVRGIDTFTTDSEAIDNRRLVTTDSFSLPIPAVQALPELRGTFENSTGSAPADVHERPLTFTDLLVARLKNAGLSEADIFDRGELEKMVSPDLLQGLRMDINRPFGNGLDENNNKVVDDHAPAPGLGLTATQIEESEDIWRDWGSLYQYEPKLPLWKDIEFDHDNDKSTATDGHLARQLFARHLFVLMMTLKDGSFTVDSADDVDTSRSTRETARWIAQWCINVVDYRDADSIMTPFEYDRNPHNGWITDGNILTDEGSDGMDNDGDMQIDEPDEKEREIVWGCERPELLMTETLTLHDRRTEDLDIDGDPDDDTDTRTDDLDADPDDRDKDFDQRLRPRGAFFLELYNPWTGDQTHKPAELYAKHTYGSSQEIEGVKLNKKAPGGAPVWRVLVVGDDSHNPGGEPLDPDGHDDFDNADIERAIYFTSPSALPDSTAHGRDRHFSSELNKANPAAVPVLAPGRYAVLGPPGTTYIGRRLDASDVGQPGGVNNLRLADTRNIRLQPDTNPNTGQVRVVRNVQGTSTLSRPADIPEAIAIEIDRMTDVSAGTTRNVGLNITEPDGGYSNAGFSSTAASGEGAYVPAIDTPFDVSRAAGDGANWGALMAHGTVANFRTVHLQRLANPLIPYHATANPYRTVDTASTDLTAFNGVFQPGEDPLAGDDPIPEPNRIEHLVELNGGVGNKNAVALGGHQRGARRPGVGTTEGRNIWTFEPPNTQSDLKNVGKQVSRNHVMHFTLDHTLGYLNSNFGSPFNVNNAPAAEFRGLPNSASHPFPWLNWNNRPFVSQLELMHVPASSSSRLMRDYSMRRDIDRPNANPTGTPPVADVRIRPYSNIDLTLDTSTESDKIRHDRFPGRQFGHLLNFFAGHETTGTLPHLYRLFDYTHVPSRFVGTETILEPNRFEQGLNGTELFIPPFNRVSHFRDPGRININTIYDHRVYNALRRRLKNSSGHTTYTDSNGNGSRDADEDYNMLDPTFNAWVDSRRGYGNAGASMVTFDSANEVPTFFGNPVRAADAGDLVPVEAMRRPGVDVTLLRSDSIEAVDGDTSHAAVAADPTVDPRTEAMFSTTTGTTSNNPHRNPYFRYHGLQRMANLVTTQSNVYAIWITVGFFEYDPETEQLGQESGIDTGKVRRHRAFYMVDRSIPVAFEPGKNHNVDRAVLLRRVIE